MAFLTRVFLAWSLSFIGRPVLGRFTRATFLPFLNGGFSCTLKDIH